MKPVLLNDSSVLLNLLATDCFEAIALSTGWQFAICEVVRTESKKLRDPATGDMVPVDIEPLVHAGVLKVLELAGEKEQTLFVAEAAVVDDGEAMSIAIAATRGLELAIDDKQASNHLRRHFPALKLWTTPEILKRWVETTAATAEALRKTIQLIEQRARYVPPKHHALAAWWSAARKP
jgi:hypothetical protein